MAKTQRKFAYTVFLSASDFDFINSIQNHKELFLNWLEFLKVKMEEQKLKNDLMDIANAKVQTTFVHPDKLKKDE